jgi:hypothetical protein
MTHALFSRMLTPSRAKSYAPLAMLGAVAGFVGLIVPAMGAYPGGTAWDRTAPGNDFWLNFLCDLERTVALNGEPNATGSRLTQAAMLVLTLGLVTLWWYLPRFFPTRARLGHAVRAFGSVAVVGALGVGLMPADRFGGVHGTAILLAGFPGLAAALLAVLGLVRERRAPRVLAALGAVAVLVSAVDFGLYVRQNFVPDPGPVALAILERVSIIVVLAWICAVALSARHRAVCSELHGREQLGSQS